MILLPVYRILLRMYPPDYRRQFGDEMASVFERAAADHLQKGPIELLRFAARELFGLAFGARDAWRAPLLIEQVGADFSVPADLADAQRLVTRCKSHLEEAIVARDFKKARFLCLVEERAREDVRRLRAKYRLPEA